MLPSCDKTRHACLASTNSTFAVNVEAPAPFLLGQNTNLRFRGNQHSRSRMAQSVIAGSFAHCAALGRCSVHGARGGGGKGEVPPWRDVVQEIWSFLMRFFQERMPVCMPVYILQGICFGRERQTAPEDFLAVGLIGMTVLSGGSRRILTWINTRALICYGSLVLQSEVVSWSGWTCSSKNTAPLRRDFWLVN